jgi:signal transduction histidine kinase
VDVVNAAPRHRPSGLERSGASFGLAEMRERVAACGGSLTSGPTPAGGWQVSALLPALLPGDFA